MRPPQTEPRRSASLFAPELQYPDFVIELTVDRQTNVAQP
jgi:hypothetical protein